MIDLEIIIPIYGNYEQVKKLINSIKKQEGVNVKSISCSLTFCDEDDNKIINLFNEENIKYFTLTKEEFSHSLTREKLIRSYTENRIVIMLSQDIVFENENVLYNLSLPVYEKEAAYSFARQISEKIGIERYTRRFNYPKKSYLVNASNREKMGYRAYFASDAAACYDREIFISIGGYKGYDLMMNEDQLYSLFLLDNGYTKKYVAEAIVTHSHKYSLKQLYNRYYEVGKFYKQTEVMGNIAENKEGLKMALYIFFNALIRLDIYSLIRFIPDMFMRYKGSKDAKKKN